MAEEKRAAPGHAPAEAGFLGMLALGLIGLAVLASLLVLFGAMTYGG